MTTRTKVWLCVGISLIGLCIAERTWQAGSQTIASIISFISIYLILNAVSLAFTVNAGKPVAHDLEPFKRSLKKNRRYINRGVINLKEKGFVALIEDLNDQNGQLYAYRFTTDIQLPPLGQFEVTGEIWPNNYFRAVK